jgi:hypothetical protein
MSVDLGTFLVKTCFQQTKLDERILFRLQDATKVELAEMNFVVK